MAGGPGRSLSRPRLVDGALRPQPEREADASLVDGHRRPRRHLCADPAPLRARPTHRRVARGLRHPERASCGPWRHHGVALLRGHVPAHPAIRGVGLLELPSCSRARHGRLPRHDAAIPRRARAPLRGSRGGQEVGAPGGREVRGGGGQEARDLGPRGRPRRDRDRRAHARRGRRPPLGCRGRRRRGDHGGRGVDGSRRRGDWRARAFPPASRCRPGGCVARASPHAFRGAHAFLGGGRAARSGPDLVEHQWRPGGDAGGRARGLRDRAGGAGAAA